MAPVKIPDRLCMRPRDSRGYVIPFVTFIKHDGTPDFAVLDPLNRRKAIAGRRCAICGEALTGNVFFIGGPLCERNGVFADPAMHEACARYSLAVCPHIVNPKAKYAVRKDETYVKLEAVSDKRPDRFGLFEALGYQNVILDGDLMVRALLPWVSIHWYRDGAEVKS
jgi:hypothetical protein